MSRPILLGVPYDLSSSFLPGAADAPPLIRAALRSPAGNAWSEVLVDTAGPGGLEDAGDVTVTNPSQLFAAVSDRVASLAASGHTPIVLGGDHAVTFPVVAGLRRVARPFGILHVDAHPDLYDRFDGDRGSHACPFARIMEQELVVRLVQVGIRAMNGHQRAQADRFGVEAIDMRRGAKGERPPLDGPVYVSIDLDGIDPAFAPGVSHREPGGLTVREVITLIQDLEGPLVGADIVEYNPRQDLDGLTAAVAAKLVKELTARCLGE